MRKSHLRGGAFAALALLVTLCFASEPAGARQKKEKTQPGVDDHFVGIMDPNKQVKMSDPLWERYLYAGKKQLERRDIAKAQDYYWAADYEFQDFVKENPKATLNQVALNTLSTAFSLGGDVFYEDPNPTVVRDEPPAFPQAIEADEQRRVDAQKKKLDAELADFDDKHKNFDGGARLRLLHLRRMIQFTNDMMPACKKLLGPDDEITRQVTVINENLVAEYKDLAGE
jgi:hypothetical protein